MTPTSSSANSARCIPYPAPLGAIRVGLFFWPFSAVHTHCVPMNTYDFWFGCHYASSILGALEEAQWRRSEPAEVLQLLALVPTGGSYWWPRLTIS